MAQNWGVGIGYWVLERKLSFMQRSIDYPVFSVVQFVPEHCAEIHKGTLSKILRLVCSVRVRLVNS